MRIKADALGILAEDYEHAHIEVDEVFTGTLESKVSAEVISDCYQKSVIELSDLDIKERLYPNQFLVLLQKKQTGKTPLEHAIAYAEEKNPEKKKEPCLSFVEKTNSEICAIVKKQLNLTKSKILKKSQEKPIKDHTSSLQPKIDKKSKIKYLD